MELLLGIVQGPKLQLTRVENALTVAIIVETVDREVRETQFSCLDFPLTLL